MQRKRGELDGPVQAIPAAPPQARHHFTQADQVDQLVWATTVKKPSENSPIKWARP